MLLGTRLIVVSISMLRTDVEGVQSRGRIYYVNSERETSTFGDGRYLLFELRPGE